MATKPRKNVSLDLKTYTKLRKAAFKAGVPISKMISFYLETETFAPRFIKIDTEKIKTA